MTKKRAFFLATCSVVIGLGLMACQQTAMTPQNAGPNCPPEKVTNNTVLIPIIVENAGTPVRQRTAAPVSAQPASYAQPQAAAALNPSTSTAGNVNIETPARCQIPAPTSRIISDIPLKETDFKLTRLEADDPLPRYEVNGYTFNNQPLDMAIQNLVSEAGIKVYSDDGLFPEMSAEDIRGELSSVVSELVDAGDVYFRYDEAKKKIYLSRWARFKMQIPGGRVGMYAVLDALRGANLTNVQADWGKNELYFRVTKDKEAIINRLISTLESDPRLLMFDVSVYRLVPRNPAMGLNWQTSLQDFGVQKVNMSVNGLLGRMIVTDHQQKPETFINLLKKYAAVNLVSTGVAVMPNSWKVRFDIGQCTSFASPERDLSLLLQSNIQSTDRVESNIALDTTGGEITSFYSFYSIGDNLSIIGVPGTIFNKDWKSIEYMITMKPRILRLVK